MSSSHLLKKAPTSARLPSVASAAAHFILGRRTDNVPMLFSSAHFPCTPFKVQTPQSLTHRHAHGRQRDPHCVPAQVSARQEFLAHAEQRFLRGLQTGDEAGSRSARRIEDRRELSLSAKRGSPDTSAGRWPSSYSFTRCAERHTQGQATGEKQIQRQEKGSAHRWMSLIQP